MMKKIKAPTVEAMRAAVKKALTMQQKPNTEMENKKKKMKMYLEQETEQ